MSHSRAQIVVTMGPSIQSLDVFRALIECGMDIARLDYSRGSFEDHRRATSNVRTAAAEYGRYIPIIGDLAGPRKLQDVLVSEMLTPLTDADQESIEFSLEQEIDYLVLSHVGRGEDVDHLRKLFTREGGKTGIIAKIERVEALRNIYEITAAADAVLLGRETLREEVPLE